MLLEQGNPLFEDPELAAGAADLGIASAVNGFHDRLDREAQGEPCNRNQQTETAQDNGRQRNQHSNGFFVHRLLSIQLSRPTAAPNSIAATRRDGINMGYIGSAFRGWLRIEMRPVQRQVAVTAFGLALLVVRAGSRSLQAKGTLATGIMATRNRGTAGMRSRCAVLALIGLLTLEPLQAQQLRGRVTDADTRAPIGSAQVELLDKSPKPLATVLTDQSGGFMIVGPRPGRFRVRITRLGYQESIVPDIELLGGETVDAELSIAAAAIPLEPLRIVARGRTVSVYLERSGFYEREQHGVGSFLTRYEIEKRGGSSLSDALRHVSGVRLRRADRSGRRWEVQLRNTRCPPALVLDGAIVRTGGPMRPTDMPIDDLVSLNDIDGIEIYHGPSETPPAFNRGGNCGVIVLWTRRRR